MSENSSINEQLDWKKAKVIAAGIDIGAVNSKAVILLDGQSYAFSQVRTIIPKESAISAISAIIDKACLKLENIHSVVATGTGRSQVPFARKTVSEIACAAAGAVNIWGSTVRTVLDIGGQSCKIIHCTDKGRVNDFLWNDKCAAGIGRSMESFADLVQKDITEIGKIALNSHELLRLSDFCSVFSLSEALDSILNKVPTEQVIAGYHNAMAKRISTLVAKLGLKEDLVIIGGLARNPGITNELENILEVNRLAPKPEWDSALTVALGAAIFADASYRRQQSDT
jgi:benzoyl-CoA reductase subunit A